MLHGPCKGRPFWSHTVQNRLGSFILIQMTISFCSRSSISTRFLCLKYYYIDDGGRCWRRNVLVTVFGHFGPSRSIFSYIRVTNIQKMSKISKLANQIGYIMALNLHQLLVTNDVTNITVTQNDNLKLITQPV